MRKTPHRQCLLFVIITRMEINEYNVEPKHMKAHYIALKAFGIHEITNNNNKNNRKKKILNIYIFMYKYTRAWCHNEKCLFCSGFYRKASQQ